MKFDNIKKVDDANTNKVVAAAATIEKKINDCIYQFPHGCFYDSNTIAEHRAICKELIQEAYDTNNTEDLYWVVSNALTYIERERAKPEIKKGVVATFKFTEKEQWIVSAAAAFYHLYHTKHPADGFTTADDMIAFYRKMEVRLRANI